MAREGYAIRRQDNSDKVIPLFRTNPDGTRGERITSFRSQEEMLKCMSATHPDTGESLYEKSEVFRRSVEEILNNSDAGDIGVQLEPRSPIPTDAEFLQGLREDARRQEYQRLVERAGGNDAIAKLEFAQSLVNPTEAQHEQYSEINQLTQLDASRPVEAYLRERKASGLGPDRQSIQVFDVRDDKYESQKEQEALAYLESQDDIAL